MTNDFSYAGSHRRFDPNHDHNADIRKLVEACVQNHPYPPELRISPYTYGDLRSPGCPTIQGEIRNTVPGRAFFVYETLFKPRDGIIRNTPLSPTAVMESATKIIYIFAFAENVHETDECLVALCRKLRMRPEGSFEYTYSIPLPGTEGLCLQAIRSTSYTLKDVALAAGVPERMLRRRFHGWER